MTKKKNTGFSMVEILISLAIFMILMIPIVSGIISSLKMSTGSKELQYRNDFAENLMEYIKTAPIEEITKKDFYEANGTLPGTFNPGSGFVKSAPKELSWDPSKKVSQTSCTLSGQTTLGTENTLYNYLVQIDNGYYVDKMDNDDTFVDPNNLALGIVEDIDYTKVALFDGTMLNYDKTAATAFRTKKLQVLKEIDEERYNQQMQGEGTDLFIADTASRMMTIEVSGDAASGYVVRCILDYIDSNGMLGTDNHIQYVSDARSFDSKLPNIYLMYNPCVYNGDYSWDDYIAIDTSGLDDSEVNFFLVETAERYSQNIIDADPDDKILDATQKNKILYNTAEAAGVGRKNANIHIMAMNKQSADGSFVKNINIYHNIGDNVDGLGMDKRNKKSELDKFFYDIDPSSITKLNEFMDKLNTGVAVSERKKLFTLVAGGSSGAFVGKLSDAKEESRGLYQVKVWLKQDVNGVIDPSTDQPILQGTKGGNET